MMTHSTLWLAELQFFLSLGFMALFFAIELGLSWVLFVFRLRSLGKAAAIWLDVYRTWVRVFALAFVLSFAASIPVFLLLGGLWPQFLSVTAPLGSPLLAALIVTTLIFKSSALGLMLYAQRRIPGWAHTLVVGAVALLNTGLMVLLLGWVSWLHHPVGAQWADGVLLAVDWAQVFSNPLLLWYGLLFVGASVLLVGCLVQALIFWRSLRRPAGESERRAFRFILFCTLAGWLLILAGVWGHGLWLAGHQAYKAAAMAGHWDSAAPLRWLLAAWADEEQQRHRFSLGIPLRQTWWLATAGPQQFIGLDKSVGMLPPVNAVFWSFRVALLLGGLIGLLQGRTLWLALRRHFDPGLLGTVWRRLLLSLPFLAALLLWAGMTYQLLGVLPYAVYNVLTTSDLYAHLPFGWLSTALIAMVVLYGLAIIGFVSLVHYVARHGVIPVARHRGRA